MFKPLGLVLLICVATLALVAGCTDGESGGGGGGGSTPAGLAITPNPVAFGTVSTSSTTTVTVTVTNNATTSIDVTSVSILNDTNTVFSLVGAPGATTPIAAIPRTALIHAPYQHRDRLKGACKGMEVRASPSRNRGVNPLLLPLRESEATKSPGAMDKSKTCP